jgi:uncharacterized protein YkwD
MLILAPPEPPPKAKSTVVSDVQFLKSLLIAHNRERSEAKLEPLVLDAKLTAAAVGHARDMAEHGRMTHDGSDGSTAGERVERRGYHYIAMGENVAEGQKTVEDVMKIWMESPHHRENILGSFSQVGFAIARDADGAMYWCTDFATPRPKQEAEKAIAEVIEAVNKTRAEEKRPALKVSPKLARIASDEAERLSRTDVSKPAQGDGREIIARIEKAGYRYRSVAQTSATGLATPEEVVKTWLQSEPHKEMILGDFTELGVGYALAPKDVPCWMLILGRPLR